MEIKSHITNDFIDSLVESQISRNEELDVCTEAIAKKKVAEWQADGSFVVANAGAYDVLGLNHIRGLVQARIAGAAYKLGSAEDLDAVYDLASSDDIRLVVSLDTNSAVKENKSFSAENGGSVRPILDWNTRARMLALQSIRSRHNLVDFITKHGPEACSVCGGDNCWHSNKTYNVASTGADLTIVKSLDRKTIERYPDSRFHSIDERDGAFRDSVLDNQISTTALVRRIRKGLEA